MFSWLNKIESRLHTEGNQVQIMADAERGRVEEGGD